MISGYKTLDYAKETITKIYDVYNLPKELKKYPTFDERLKIIEHEKNNLKNEVNKLINNEENRNETLRKSIASTNTLQQNLQTEIARVNDERVEKEKKLLGILHIHDCLRVGII